MSEEKPCSISCDWLKDHLDFSFASLLRVMIPLPRKTEPLSRVERGVAPTQMPVHLRPTQVVGSSDLRHKFGFLWPPLLKQCWLSPIAKEGIRRYRKEICLNQKDVERCPRTLFSVASEEGEQALPVTSKVPMTPLETCVVEGDQEGAQER
jgi:hypothetical protein